LITEEQIKSGEVEVGTRVCYTMKDGTRIYGTVRGIYPKTKKISIKPDSVNDDYKAYPQSYSWRRLTIEGRTEFFGLQVAPLVMMSRLKSTPDKLKRVFSCSDGLFVTDGRKLFLEKTTGLKDGYLAEEATDDIHWKEIRDQQFNSTQVNRSTGLVQVRRYNEMDLGKKIASITVDQKAFNRFIKKISYSTDNYHGKWSDVGTLVVRDGRIELSVFDKRSELCGSHVPDDGVITKTTGKVSASYMLYDLKELTKGIRTKKYTISFYPGGTILLETEEQKRVLTTYDRALDGTVQLAENRKGK